MCILRQGLVFCSMNVLEYQQLIIESFLPWKMIIGQLNFSILFFTQSSESKRDLAILALRKGIISLSSKILCSFLLFLVKDVGFIIPLIIRSQRSSPNCRTTKSLALGKWRSEGNPKKGLVIMHPVTFIQLLWISSFMLTRPPMLWAYRNNGKSGRAWLKSVITSFCIIYTVEQARGPPEQPKPVRSMRSTSN